MNISGSSQPRLTMKSPGTLTRLGRQVTFTLDSEVVQESGHNAAELWTLTPDLGEEIASEMVQYLEDPNNQAEDTLRTEECCQRLSKELSDLTDTLVSNQLLLNRDDLQYDLPGRTATSSWTSKPAAKLKGTDTSFKLKLLNMPSGAPLGMSETPQVNLCKPTRTFHIDFPNRWTAVDGTNYPIQDLKGSLLGAKMTSVISSELDRGGNELDKVDLRKLGAKFRQASESAPDTSDTRLIPDLTELAYKPYVVGRLRDGYSFRAQGFPRSSKFLEAQASGQLDREDQAPMTSIQNVAPSMQIIRKRNKKGIEKIIFKTNGSFKAGSEKIHHANADLIDRLTKDTWEFLNGFKEQLNDFATGSEGKREEMQKDCCELATFAWDRTLNRSRMFDFSGVRENTEKKSMKWSDEPFDIGGKPYLQVKINYYSEPSQS